MAAAVATLSESTPAAIGMRTLVSAAARASAVRPGPSAPRSNASLGADGSTVDSGTDGGWGATVASVVADEGFELLDAPVRRVAGNNVPLPFADALEQQVIPTVDKVVTAVRRLVAY